jgi:hypothetical protein
MHDRVDSPDLSLCLSVCLSSPLGRLRGVNYFPAGCNNEKLNIEVLMGNIEKSIIKQPPYFEAVSLFLQWTCLISAELILWHVGIKLFGSLLSTYQVQPDE